MCRYFRQMYALGCFYLKKIKILQGGTLPKLQFSKHINDSIKDLHTA